ncbi:DUF4391 domain-containing protein [Enterococcus pallens]|uniref:DUF4391 domain-containing protein n=1 Tax=Enterococcus pallens ATCC BAA-351 TaxID=1158607 RepID=R2QFF8_9ENTE|nr:DUF4391 domain-containing protein [Enterococcus pallens]EOH95247.1 hypothetical protein UAU_01209 [Enterococcus pallens ATCC BAA-351]EOU21616.1 hypothetical protein I588_02463 [Enterococcus pallens ATCC BAA-351]OJG79770.1 hypothetical protein RV10_GL000558 [Enterococcus pallens]
MEIVEIINAWQFPPNTLINRYLPKNDFYKHLRKTEDKRLVQKMIKRIWWLASFKSETTNIPIYESENELYTEIEFLYVQMNEQVAFDKIFQVLSNAIPYPLVVFVAFPEDCAIYTGKYERKKDDYLKLIRTYPSACFTEGEIQNTLKKLSLQNLPSLNFKVFYEGINNAVSATVVEEEFGVYKTSIDAQLKDDLERLSQEIAKLENRAKEEKQLNKKIPILLKLKNKKEEQESLLRSI